MAKEDDHFGMVGSEWFGHVGSDDLDVGMASCSVLVVVNYLLRVRLEKSQFVYDDADSIPVFCFPRAVDYLDMNRISLVGIELLPGIISMRNSHPSESAFTSENPFQKDN